MLSPLFGHFINRSVAFTEADLAELAAFIPGNQVRQAARSMRVLGHIERRLAKGAGPEFVATIEAVLASLRADLQERSDAFERAAVTRLSKTSRACRSA